MKKKKEKILICQRCGHSWTYRGNAEYYTSCGICRTSVNIRQDNIVKMPDKIEQNEEG